MIRTLRSPDVMWYVEYWDDEECSDFPLATAYVWEYQDHDVQEAEMCFVLVADAARRKGIAAKLLDECAKRWPRIHITEAVSVAGRALMRSFAERHSHEEH